MSSAAISTSGTSVERPCMAAAKVSTPSMPDSALGSPVMTKKWSQLAVSAKPACPWVPMARSGVSWKQRYAFASQSPR